MAEETRLKEDALVAEMQPQVAPQPATPAEVATAQAEAPVTAEPAAIGEDVEAPENFNTAADLEAGVEEPATEEAPVADDGENIEVRAQINKEDLVAAVTTAMNTGDVEAAEPDIPDEAVVAEEVVEEEAPVAEGVPVAEEAPAPAAPAPAPAAPVLESMDLTDEELDVIQEYRKYKASKIVEAAEDREIMEEDPEEAFANAEPAEDFADVEPVDDAEEDKWDFNEDEFAIEDDGSMYDVVDTTFGGADTFDDDEDFGIVDSDLGAAISGFINDLDVQSDGTIEASDALRQVADFIDTGVFEKAEDDVEEAEEEAEEVEVEEDDFVEEKSDIDTYTEKLHRFIREARDVVDDVQIWAADADIESKTLTEAIRWATGAIKVLTEAKIREAEVEESMKFAEKGAVQYPAGTPALTESDLEDPAIFAPSEPADDTRLVNESVEQEEPLDDELEFDEDGFEETTAPETATKFVREAKKPVRTRKQAIQNYRESVTRHQEAKKQQSRSYNKALNNGVRIQEHTAKKVNPNSWAANKTIDRYKEKLNIEDLFNGNLLG